MKRCNWRLLGGWAVAVSVALFAPCLAAQPTPSAPAPADELPAPYQDPARAIGLLLPRIAADPARLDLRIAAARELSTLGVTEPSRDQRLARIDQAEAQARAAVRLDSLSADAHYWLAAAFGLRCDESSGFAEISAAKSAYAEAMTTLRLDPMNPGAHHILGRLHAGALGLGRVSRLIARALGLGPVIATASVASAEQHLRIAVEGDPDRWVNELELARFLMDQKRAAEASQLLRGIGARTPRSDLDRHMQTEAARLLAALP